MDSKRVLPHSGIMLLSGGSWEGLGLKIDKTVSTVLLLLKVSLVSVPASLLAPLASHAACIAFL